jgi:hypothetical protein
MYIPHIVGHPHGGNLDIQETVLHVVDIVSLRPEMELCYVAIGGKCFEILERNGPLPRRRPTYSASPHHSARQEADDDEEEEDGEEEEAMSEEEEGDALTDGEEEEASEGEVGESSDGESSVSWSGTRRLWLQEILFYDKITIFKARHGKL